jgi:hypothetical protein
MNSSATIVHAAADLRRKALLAESERDRRTAPPGVFPRGAGLRQTVRRLAVWAAAAISRIVDDFEPSPHPVDPAA